MIEMTPTPSMTDEEVEAWFAAAGLNASVVERCSVAGCARCDHRSLTRAA
jgi:hypothetical protein